LAGPRRICTDFRRSRKDDAFARRFPLTFRAAPPILAKRAEKRGAAMRTIVILAQAAFISMVAVIGAYGDSDHKAPCPLPAAAEAAQHCEVER